MKGDEGGIGREEGEERKEKGGIVGETTGCRDVEVVECG